MPGRFPALLTRTPYNKDGVAGEGRYYAERGYVVVANDVRGRYASEGTWRADADDPRTASTSSSGSPQQDWSDGKIGTFGTSYPGGTQHALAEMNPPHLTTMVPIDSRFQLRGERNAARRGIRAAVHELDLPDRRAEQQGRAGQPRISAGSDRERPEDSPARRQPARSTGTTPLRVVPEYEAWLVEAMRSGPEAPFWHTKGMSVVDHVNDYADVPVLHVTGWYDSWTRQVTMNYEALSRAKKSPQRLVIGPWTHGGQNSNVAGEVEFTSARRRSTSWLSGCDGTIAGSREIKNGVDDDPPGLALHHGHRR